MALADEQAILLSTPQVDCMDTGPKKVYNSHIQGLRVSYSFSKAIFKF